MARLDRIKELPGIIAEKFMDYKERRGVKGIIIPLCFVVIVLAAIFFYLNRGYSSYKELEAYSSEANPSVKFTSYKSKVIRYSNDGVSLLDDKFQAEWSQGFNMQKPMVDVCGDYIAVADTKGDCVYLFNGSGLVKKINVTYTVEQVRVTSKGSVVTVLGDKDRKYLKYYDKEGELIAEGMVQLKKTGYPMNIDVSDDGRLLVVSYLYVSNGIMKSNVVFYNFDNMGQTQLDKIVASYEYESTVIPEIRFFGNEQIVAVGDNAVYIYEGREKPGLKKTIKFSEELESVFFDNDKFGLTFNLSGDEYPYRTEVYRANGTRIGNFKMDATYDTICFSGQNVLAYNDIDCKLFSMSGAVKFSYTFDTRIYLIQPVNGRDRFVLVTSDAAKVIGLQ